MLPGARTDVRFARSVRAGDDLAEECRYSCYATTSECLSE